MKKALIKRIAQALIPAAVIMTLSLPPVAADSVSLSFNRQFQPLMAHIPPIIGMTEQDNKPGYSAESDRGEGVIIAVLDAAFDVTHEIFAPSDEVKGALSLDGMSNMKGSLAANSYYGASQYKAADLYVSAKIPFAYDYAHGDADVLSPEFHGTHIAAIAAGSEAGGGEFDGVAPDAQLILMKIAYDNGVFCEEAVIADAIDDAVALGADVINLSFGSVSGSTEYYYNYLTSEAVDRALRNGVVVVCAAGNEGQASAGSRYSIDYGVNSPSVMQMDYGLVSEPSTLPGAISVGAAYNSVIHKKTLTVVTKDTSSDVKVEYINPDFIMSDDNKLAFANVFSGKTVTVVPVGGVGDAAEYERLASEKISVKGKVVLVARGEITFAEKITYASEAGAAGIIIYNNIPDNDIVMAVDEIKIPAVSVSYEDGRKLLGEYEASGSLKIAIPKNPNSVETDENEGRLTYFSSWGPTPELALKPEITAVGSSVYSAVNGGGYGAYNGTSMASPMVASASALVRAKMMREDYVLERGSSFEDTAMSTLSAKIKMTLMNTASVMANDSGTAYSPRHQGAGLLDVSAALSADTFMYSGKTEDMTYEAKVELGGDLLSIYTFPITVYNASDTEKEYLLSGCVQSDGYNEVAIDAHREYFIDLYNPRQFTKSTLTVLEDESDANLNRYSKGAGEYSLTLEGGERRTLYISVSINQSELKEYNKIFKNGWFTEGYVYLTDTGNDTQTSIPYMGFIGSWDNLPMFDAFSYDNANSIYPDQVFYTLIGETAVPVGTNLFGNSMRLISDLIAFSPNKDGSADELYLGISPLRNTYMHTVEIFNSDGECAYRYFEEQAMIKLPRTDDGGYIIGIWDGSDGINNRYVFPDGEYTCVITGYALNGDPQSVSLPVRIDREKPVIESAEVTEKDGRKYLTITATDNHYIQTALLYDKNTSESELPYMDQYVVRYRKDAHTMTRTYDITDINKDHLYVEVVDYAFNTSVIRVDIP